MGLMLGLLIGGGFFILKLDHYFGEMSRTKDTKEKTVAEVSTSQLPEKPEKKIKPQKTRDERLSAKYDSLAAAGRNAALARFQGDSVLTDSITLVSQSDNIVVRKDELLSVKNVELVSIGAPRNSKDSVLSQLSGIKDDEARSAYKVEFWQSPINYKGYKMTRNRVLLYGITDSEAVKLFKLDDVIYLRHGAVTYRLDHTSEFRQFEKVSDESVLARIK